jgi:hypothetical protein
MVKTPTLARGCLELNLRNAHHEKTKIQGNFTAQI